MPLNPEEIEEFKNCFDKGFSGFSYNASTVSVDQKIVDGPTLQNDGDYTFTALYDGENKIKQTMSEDEMRRWLKNAESAEPPRKFKP